ncbi:hypothetical protein [Phenylobacterium sp. SCN 70-31]|uniref:hypothetical protein n=1 Tax=Phenylobacterium sp. SCN 70-31 TaxID=1660129 RepID=UPI00086BF85E|nr:hypothetical protein [Phenylobacterium sp. SCN 70-31]ODT85275.1 MAG: hypothetical protein ABS78_20950 [Phenylobacterium sp. SCN 70-31]
MTPERFAGLADAYGGDVARWPAPERDAAAAFMTDAPARAAAILAEASALDAWLDAAPAPQASAAMVGAILAAAPRRPSLWRRWAFAAGAGAGLAAACAAGVLAGVQLGAAATVTKSDIVSAEGGGDAVLAVVSDEDFNLFLDEEAG